MATTHLLKYTTLNDGVKTKELDEDDFKDGGVDKLVHSLTAASRAGGVAKWDGEYLMPDAPVSVHKITEVKTPEKPKTDTKDDGKKSAAPSTASVPAS